MKDVDFKHPDYEELIGIWHKCRVVARGEEAVKEAGPDILPMLGGQETQAYESYKARAPFYEATSRVVQALTGALYHKPVQIETTDAIDLNKFVPAYEPVQSFFRRVGTELVLLGRVGVLVDMDATGQPYFSMYAAEKAINWRTIYRGDRKELNLVVLKEKHYIADGLSVKAEDRWRVLSLEPKGAEEAPGDYDIVLATPLDQKPEYYVTVFRKKQKGTGGSYGDSAENEFEMIERTKPVIQNKAMDYIPFYFINGNGTALETCRPPLAGLVNANIHHYQLSADYAHALHFTALPTPYVIGPHGMEGKFTLGSEQALNITGDGNTRIGFLEFGGQGLGALETALRTTEEKMIILGARLLEAPKAAVEAAATQVIRRAGENNVIESMSEALSEGLTKASESAIKMLNRTDAISIKLQKEYMQREPDPSLLSQYTSMYFAGAMSWETLFWNLQRIGVYEDGTTAEDEKQNIENGPISLGDPMLGGPEGPRDDEE